MALSPELQRLVASQPQNSLLQSILAANQIAANQKPPVAAPVSPLPNPNASNGYLSPLRGQEKYGWGFNGGLGNSAKTQQSLGKGPDGAGLWAAGYDVNDPNITAKLKAYQAANPDAQNLNGFYKNNPNGSYTQAMDWYFRDISRRMSQSNNFLDSTLGSVLGAVGQIGLGFVPGVGPLLSAGLGAGLGAAKGGVLGGVLGGIGGYGSGSLGASLAANGIKGTIANTVNSVKGLFGSGGGFTNPAGLGLSAANMFGGTTASNGLGTGGLGLLTPNIKSLGGIAGLNSLLGSGTVSNGLGLTASMLYNPVTMGGTASSGFNFDKVGKLLDVGGLIAELGGSKQTPALSFGQTTGRDIVGSEWANLDAFSRMAAVARPPRKSLRTR